MYIYNVTINIDEEAHDEWLMWMKKKHIPDVMDTGLFLGNRILEVMVEEESGRTYSIQYKVKDMETLRLYQEVYATRLQQEHTDLFEGKFVSFRTVLRIEEEFE